MARLTVQTLVRGRWHDAARLELAAPDRGAAGPCEVEYDFDYFAAWAGAAMIAFLSAGYVAGVMLPASEGEDTFAGLMFGSRDYIEQSADIFRQLNSEWGVAVTSISQAFFALDDEDVETARALGKQSITACQEIGIWWGVASSYEVLGWVQGRGA